MNPRLQQLQRQIGRHIITQDAEALQRKGMTLTEIAIELGRPRQLIVELLYTQKVRP